MNSHKHFHHLVLTLSLYWLVTYLAANFLVFPPLFANSAVFLAPLLTLMWGPWAALGVYAGSLLSAPELTIIIKLGSIDNWWRFLAQHFYAPLSGLLPFFIWHRWRIKEREPAFPLGTGILYKFILCLLFTFALTSLLRSLTASDSMLEMVGGLLGPWKNALRTEYFLACFINDFTISVFFDLACFFFLVGRGYAFYHPKWSKGIQAVAWQGGFSVDARRIWLIAMGCYFVFPAVAFYLDVYQIYGMDDLKTYLRFVAECLLTMDACLALMLYLLLKYRRSIMMEVVFLVCLTIFLSTGILGWVNSYAMRNMAVKDADDSLRAMSVICRERLDRTFHCVRQAINGMKEQAQGTLVSYDKLANDPLYREDYLQDMKMRFADIAMTTDGALAFYLRLNPDIAGGRGGFSMGRRELRWEGALSDFVEREPIDITKYKANDYKNVGWYYIPLTRQQATWIEPYVDPTAKSYVVSYVAPIYADGREVGVIGMDIDFEFIIQELRRMSIYDYGYAYLMNRNGIVLYHKDLPQGAPFLPNKDYQEIERYLSNGMWLGIATPLSRVNASQNAIVMNMVAIVVLVAMLISLGSIALASRSIKPLKGMTEAAKRIASGDLNVQISYESGNELGILVKSIREMATKLEAYVYRDKLTGLKNAAAYMGKGKELDDQLAAGADMAYGVVIFDANFLKKINDQYGHQAGNELLKHAAQVICRVYEHSPVYRIGGDEFAAIIENHDYENREALLKRFDKETAQETFAAGGEEHRLSVARGLGVYEPGLDFKAVVKRADAAMYNHKAAIKAKFGEEVR